MTQRKTIVAFGVCGLTIAILLAAIRLYLLYRYRGEVEDWFNSLTLIFWPGAFYLTVMQARAPVTVALVVWSVAIFANTLVYAFVGWIAWRVSRFLRPR
jgi:hypothetical protein